MTALNWLFFDESIAISADTLSLNKEKCPYMYTSKIFIVPHLKLVICGTGNLKLFTDWYLEVTTKMACRDFHYVNQLAQEYLTKLNVDLPKHLNSTVYHFAYDEEQKKCVGFAFRSKRNFQCESIQVGTATKPPLPAEFIEKTDLNAQSYQEYFIKIMKEQKRIDDAKPQSDKVGVGGEIQFLLFSPNQFVYETIYRFATYEEDFQRMRDTVK